MHSDYSTRRNFSQNTKIRLCCSFGRTSNLQTIKLSKRRFVTILFRKYYNPPVSFDHRRIWPKKENQKEELEVEGLRENPESQNLEVGKNLLVDIQ